MGRNLLETPIEYLKGVGPKRADILKKEIQVFNFGDLLGLFPFRYIDKTKFESCSSLHADIGEVQLKGVLRRVTMEGQARRKRLVAKLRDDTGAIELVWFQGASYMQDKLVVGKTYIVYGRVSAYGSKLSIAHPEIEELKAGTAVEQKYFAPVYASTDKLNSSGLDSKGRRRLVSGIFEKASPSDFPENLPKYLLEKLKLIPRAAAMRAIHFPKNAAEQQAASNRLKFEELFFLQLGLLQQKYGRQIRNKGYVFGQVGSVFHTFFETKIPFELTGAQKRVIKEIRADMKRGVQMNRLLQGDVGSGKTMVGLMCMLIAIDNGYQACMVAPTEILAQQHLESLSNYLEGLDVQIDLLTGSIKGKKRKDILERLADGSLNILVGTHAIFEDPVVFKNLGLAITDEQHRFGVAQRAKLWQKSSPYPPHILVMTATPIPRTLAMTLYGDLDVSVIDELPVGRKPVQTQHKTENHRASVFGFLRKELEKGRQAYIVYPLIAESEKLDLLNLEEGLEAVQRSFPRPDYEISVVHGKMKPADKEFEMQRFKNGETQIMVATTVIEVGVNVPNASIMIIENTERFGLSQLHQLRGRVGRGADQSYCILMSSFKLSNESKERIATMVRTTNGFEIAEADLKLRGPGAIAGTRQSGVLDLKIADLAKDGIILQTARQLARMIMDKDPNLSSEANARLKWWMDKHGPQSKGWSKIS